MGRIFELDAQLLFDTIVIAINVFILFTVCSYLFFEPVRAMLDKRRDKIKSDIEDALQNKEDAKALKEEYELKLNEVGKEAEEILGAARKKALKREEEIIAEAKAEAEKIRERARKELELEKKQAIDDMKLEMIELAKLMAGSVIAKSVDVQVQDKLIEDALKEMGDGTWQN
ncbi:MAG: F0F1 ATP synthase subunit B [Lachnospiraceae bacterium]|nr:F0F1 ATP synthase subunit B [Lachnospiraceae bacterium]